MNEGDVLADRYTLVRIIGSGGMGAVWLAEHASLKTELAIKVVHANLVSHPDVRARFNREAQIAARLKSVHVVHVFDHGVTDDGQPFIAMEFLAGESVRDRLDAMHRLSVDETATVVKHTCRALTKAHEAGLIHRDLKPENLFIVKESDEDIIKVLDFGVAKSTDALAYGGVDPTRTGALMGTPYYMSPEQALGLKEIDVTTDLWALGALVFECLTGVRPFTAPALGPLIAKIVSGPVPVPSQVAPDAALTPEIDAWMARALSRDKAKRFTTAREFSEAFMVASGSVDSLMRSGGHPVISPGHIESMTAATMLDDVEMANTVSANRDPPAPPPEATSPSTGLIVTRMSAPPEPARATPRAADVAPPKASSAALYVVIGLLIAIVGLLTVLLLRK